MPATVVGYDLYDDVGVIRVDPALHALDPVPLGDSSRVVVGQPVAAIGSPFGNTDSLSVGVVSAIRRSIPSLTSRYNLVDAIQTDAPINHGNSGGPLFDARGRAIGINAQIRSSGTGSGFEGVGFAVPIDSARRSMAQLLSTGTVRYAYVGITTEDLTPSIAKKFGYAAKRGALIDAVTSGSAADRAGLEAGPNDAVFEGQALKVGGDAVVAIDGVPVTNAEDVVRIVSERLLPGETVPFTVVHGAARRVVRVTLGERPAKTVKKASRGNLLCRANPVRTSFGRISEVYLANPRGKTGVGGRERAHPGNPTDDSGQAGIHHTRPARPDRARQAARRAALAGGPGRPQAGAHGGLHELRAPRVRRRAGQRADRLRAPFRPARRRGDRRRRGLRTASQPRAALDGHELTEGGLGIAIIEALADELEIRERVQGGSSLRFVKLLDG